jgi:tRNA dimethylallyltransferase
VVRSQVSADVIVIAGPTACGKSALALHIAEDIGGEIVCADSRQLYQGMRIASAAPDDADHARVPHHLYESVPPEGPAMTAGAWAARADALVTEIQARGRVPILVGGTGLYLRAWRIGLEEPSDPVVRARIDGEATADLAAAYERLRSVDRDAADAIEATDQMRIVRALEIFEVSGRPRGAFNPLAKPMRPIAADATWLLLDAPLDALEPLIRARAARMFSTAGIVEEVQALAARLPAGHKLLDTLGVAEALDVAGGRATRDDAVTRTTLRTRQYARRQRTWFKKEPWWRRLDALAPDVVEQGRAALGHPASPP